MRTRVTRSVLAAVAAGGLAVSLLPGSGAGASVPRQSSAKCPLSALDKADGTVEITMWHSMPRANGATLQQLADEFNSSQDKVNVTLVDQVTYQDTLEKYVAGLSTGDLPDLAQIGDGDTQQMIDTQSVLPAQACVKADKYDLSGHLERVIDYYTVDKTLWPMPFNVSGPVLYYDENAFTAAGLDPTDPPKTLDDIKADSQTIVDAGVAPAGYGLKTEPGYLEQYLAKANKEYVNNGNGRNDRATDTVFDNKTGVDVYTWMQEMVDEGLAKVNSDEGGSVFDNLLGNGNGTHDMTTETSASLGTISEVLDSGAYPNVKLGVAPMPGPTGKGGVVVDGAALWISNKSEPAKQAAAWEFAKFLNTADSQATWAAGTGYVPIVTAAADSSAVQELWARIPGYKVAYDQLLTGASNLATAGPIIGDYTGVQNAVRESWQRMFSEGTSPKSAIKEAADASDSAMQEYNSRVGG
jgi:sn-glycerol 3-phosphate transport system substrate-binding protein